MWVDGGRWDGFGRLHETRSQLLLGTEEKGPAICGAMKVADVPRSCVVVCPRKALRGSGGMLWTMLREISGSLGSNARVMEHVSGSVATDYAYPDNSLNRGSSYLHIQAMLLCSNA